MHNNNITLNIFLKNLTSYILPETVNNVRNSKLHSMRTSSISSLSNAFNLRYQIFDHETHNFASTKRSN